MHLITACLPLVLLAAVPPTHCISSQLPWNSYSPVSFTLVDALNADPDYSSLLRLLQRARLIPTLNKLNGSTLFAPTNDAIKKHSMTNLLWQNILDSQDNQLPDNIQEQLRQQLFYHLLNESLLETPKDNNTRFLKTLLYPRDPRKPPSREPPPWMPIPTGALGREPQRLRIATHGKAAYVGTDAFGNGGAKIVKDVRNASNGVLLGISQVLEPPPDLATVVSRHPSTSYFHKVMTLDIMTRLNSTSQLTLFLPVDEAWNVLDPVERLYLESEFATDDLNRILNMHAVVQDDVKWSESFDPALNLTTIEGSNLDIVVTSEGVKVKGANLTQPDIYASNGVLHLVSSLLISPVDLKLTPEKYLLGLNCTKFISLIHSVDLTQLINDTESKYTILAPRDDILSVFGDPELPEKGSNELKKLLQYHFIPGRWTPSKLKNGLLLETALHEPGLNARPQVLPVEVDSNGKDFMEKSIRFGGAGVIDDFVEINNTVIYFISRPLVPPSDALETILPFLNLSSFLAAVFSTSQAQKLREAPSTSFLVPRNEAFQRLGLLVSGHLLASSSKDDLENVIFHHVLNTVEYAESLQNGSQHTFATLEGTDIKFDRLANGTSFVSSSGGWASLQAKLYPRNLLTQTGVIHELSDILIPRSVRLTTEKLVKAAQGSTMATLVNKAGFEWILNGTAPPDDSPWADDKFNRAGLTLLCPSDDAFKDYNLTQLYSDLDGLKRIVAQHLIPTPLSATDDPTLLTSNDNRPLIFDDATYSTLHSVDSAYGDVVFQQRSDSKEYVVGIKGARGTKAETDWARVLSWGRATFPDGRGGVIQIDRLLIPYQPSWWTEYGGPGAVGIIGVIAICMFFYGVRLVWRIDTTEATYEPVGGYGRDDDD